MCVNSIAFHARQIKHSTALQAKAAATPHWNTGTGTDQYSRARRTNTRSAGGAETERGILTLAAIHAAVEIANQCCALRWASCSPTPVAPDTYAPQIRPRTTQSDRSDPVHPSHKTLNSIGPSARAVRQPSTAARGSQARCSDKTKHAEHCIGYTHNAEMDRPCRKHAPHPAPHRHPQPRKTTQIIRGRRPGA